MYNILIVDDEETLLEAFEDYLSEYANDLGLFTAGNGKEAVRILENTPVDLVVTDLMMPEMDGFELLSFVNNNYPSIPIIVMSGYGTAETRNRLREHDSLLFLDKPVKFKELEDAIFAGLRQDLDKGSIVGVSLASFVQLIGTEQKTCLLQARPPGKKPGYIYFHKGKPWDAVWGELKGKDAAIEIIGWEKAEINFKSLPKKKVRKRIETELMGLVMEAVSRSDEKAAEAKREAQKAAASPAAETAPGVESAEEAVSIDEVLSMDESDISDAFAAESAGFAEADRSAASMPAAGRPFFAEETEATGEKSGVANPISEALADFLAVPGVEAVLVADAEGAVVQSATNSQTIDMAKVGASSAMVSNGVAKMGSELEISGFQSLMLESGDAVIVGAPLGDKLLVIVSRDAQRLGMIRLRIRKKGPDLEKEFAPQP